MASKKKEILMSKKLTEFMYNISDREGIEELAKLCSKLKLNLDSLETMDEDTKRDLYEKLSD